MTLTHTLSHLLAAARSGDQDLLAICAQEHVSALMAQVAPDVALGCQTVLTTWRTEAQLPADRYLGRFLYRGKPATVYIAEGLEGLVLDHRGDGRVSLRVTNPPVIPEDGRSYIDAAWLHDDVAVRIEPGTYAALYHLDEGGWTLDHSPSAVPGLVDPMPAGTA